MRPENDLFALRWRCLRYPAFSSRSDCVVGDPYWSVCDVRDLITIRSPRVSCNFSTAAELLVKFQSDWKSLNPNLAASRFREILQQDVLPLSEYRPWCCWLLLDANHPQDAIKEYMRNDIEKSATWFNHLGLLNSKASQILLKTNKLYEKNAQIWSLLDAWLQSNILNMWIRNRSWCLSCAESSFNEPCVGSTPWNARCKYIFKQFCIYVYSGRNIKNQERKITFSNTSLIKDTTLVNVHG